MQLIITGSGRLSLALAGAAVSQYGVRLLSESPRADLPPGVEQRVGDLRDPGFAAEGVAGGTALAHLAPLETEGADLEVIDRATRGTYVLLQAAREAGLERVVLGSTLALFRRLPAAWRVSETWRPRPEPVLEQLGPWLAELSAREFSRLTAPPAVVCLRFGRLGDGVGEGSAAAPDALHPEDAVAALRRALEFQPIHPGWYVYHVTSTGYRSVTARRAPLEFTPAHGPAGSPPLETPGQPAAGDWRSQLQPVEPVPSRTIRKVVVFGAGGPLAAETARVMAASHTLRLTDLKSIAEIHASGQRQSPHAPLPEPLGSPHEMRQVDVTDPDQVMAAAEGMDAILNCTVIRHDPVEAFRVNTLGCYNIARAAVAHRIRRVVQTGPQMVTLAGSGGYWADYDVPGDAPPRPLDHLYGHSKYLGQEILRVFANHYGLEVPVLLFCMFVNPQEAEASHLLHPFSISWEDAAHGLRRAVEVASFPSPYEVMNLLADTPHGRFTNDRAKQLLGWQPRDAMERFWAGS